MDLKRHDVGDGRLEEQWSIMDIVMTVKVASAHSSSAAVAVRKINEH